MARLGSIGGLKGRICSIPFSYLLVVAGSLWCALAFVDAFLCLCLHWASLLWICVSLCLHLTFSSPWVQILFSNALKSISSQVQTVLGRSFETESHINNPSVYCFCQAIIGSLTIHEQRTLRRQKEVNWTHGNSKIFYIENNQKLFSHDFIRIPIIGFRGLP